MSRCNKCGNKIKLAFTKYYVPDFEGVRHDICKECFIESNTSEKTLKWDAITQKVVWVNREDAEIRKMCRSCGHIMCYTPIDLDNNKKTINKANLNAFCSFANTIDGHYAAGAIYSQAAQNERDKIKDYSRCPLCGSIDLATLTKAEIESHRYSNAAPITAPTPPAISPVEEIKKFKTLFDLGLITQEEFDSVKKQLLGI